MTVQTTFEGGLQEFRRLSRDFTQHEEYNLSSAYPEARVRLDFLDPLLESLGWDVGHHAQRNPYEQEVLVEKNVSTSHGHKRADYAFHLAPNYRDVQFFVEAKKPTLHLETDADGLFQTIRYGWNAGTGVALLTDFYKFVVVDCRSRPDPATARSRIIFCLEHGEMIEEDNFAKIYWLFSREAVATGSLDRFCQNLAKPKGAAKQLRLFRHSSSVVDNGFLQSLEEYRERLAKAFKREHNDLDGETLTEITQRVLDRLVFLRFLEDKLIETKIEVSKFGLTGSTWADFVAASAKLDKKYNGIVFKHHDLIDQPGFLKNDDEFADVCDELSDSNSPYDFNAIPIHVLGSIYELFLGKVIVTTDKKARIEDKPEVKKAGGVFYTPSYIVDLIVDTTISEKLSGKSPKQIANLKFADIACGSGSFLLGLYDRIMRHVTLWYNSNPDVAEKEGCVKADDGTWRLSLHQRRQILVSNIFGVDIDAQAVEVSQLSLYLKLLENETTSSTYNHQLEFEETILPSLNRNVMCGNSLVEPEGLQRLMFSPDEERNANAFPFRRRFKSRELYTCVT